MSELNELIELIYIATGIGALVVITMILSMLKSEGPELLKSMVFLRFDTVIKAIYISLAAATFYVVVNIARYMDVFIFVHDIGEMISNLGIIISLTIIYRSLKKKD